MTQRCVELDDRCKAIYGSYVQATTDAMVTHDQKSRTHGCIVLGPSGNCQGSLKCFDLETGKIVIRIIAIVILNLEGIPLSIC